MEWGMVVIVAAVVFRKLFGTLARSTGDNVRVDVFFTWMIYVSRW